jgi:hypothetical protein
VPLWRSISAIKEVAWTLSTIAAIIGTTMVAAGMIEELPDILRSTFRRTIKR